MRSSPIGPASRIHNAALILGLLASSFLASCTQYKPSSYRGSIGNTPVAGTSQNAQVAPVENISPVLANTKLGEVGGTLTAKVTYGTQNVSKDFTPTGTQSTLSDMKLPVGSPGIMIVEIYQGDVLKFVAKKANPTFVDGTKNVVVDDCLILRAPRAGTVNEGSCEWSITEVAN